MMIPYKVIECSQETNSAYVRMCTRHFIEPVSVTIMLLKNNMLKLWDKSENYIDNQRITFTCIGALQTSPHN